jgi:hypothetical protein
VLPRLVRWEILKINSDHSDAKKEMDLVRVSVVQIGQVVQNSPSVNGNGSKWEQLVDRVGANRHTLHKFLDGRASFTGLFHMYATTYKEMGESLQLSSMESEQEVVSQAEQNKH